MSRDSRGAAVLVALAVVVTGAFAMGCGSGDSGTSSSAAEQKGREEGRREALRAQRTRDLENKLKTERRRRRRAERQQQNQAPTPTTTTVPSTTTSPSPISPDAPASRTCGNYTSVGPGTTCEFADNVKAAWQDAGGGNATVSAYSPTTGKTYSVTCSEGTTTVCISDTGAKVYIGG